MVMAELYLKIEMPTENSGKITAKHRLLRKIACSQQKMMRKLTKGVN